MSKSEVIAELNRLTADERAEIQAKLDELAGRDWLEGGQLSQADKHELDAAIEAYERSPDCGSPWEDVKARVQANLKQRSAK